MVRFTFVSVSQSPRKTVRFFVQYVQKLLTEKLREAPVPYDAYLEHLEKVASHRAKVVSAVPRLSPPLLEKLNSERPRWRPGQRHFYGPRDAELVQDLQEMAWAEFINTHSKDLSKLVDALVKKYTPEDAAERRAKLAKLAPALARGRGK